MKITFHGAARGVTGSKHFIETKHGKILLDCGLFQGNRRESEELNKHLPEIGKELTAVLLSHAHLDHCGALPILVKQGFAGKIYATPATVDVAKYILLDSAKIQEQDIAYLNQKKAKKGEPLEEPIYTQEEVDKVMDLFVAIPYHEEFHPMKGVRAMFFDAGHILGSAQIHLTINEDGFEKTLAYTGDLGRWKMPILRDPENLPPTQILITESTYGDRLHDSFEETKLKMKRLLIEAVQRKAKIIIPAFALGRTQEIVYMLHELVLEDAIPIIPVYVDSPLSSNITEVFGKHTECFDEETWGTFLTIEKDPFWFQNLFYTDSVDESKRINDIPGPLIIISSAGMCEYGRIRHHLANNISDPRSLVLITGFMAENTLGRKIIRGDKQVKIWDEMYDVRAEIQVFNGFSAHADYQEILKHVRNTEGLETIFLVHGEDTQIRRLYERLHILNPDFIIHRPKLGDSYELNTTI